MPNSRKSCALTDSTLVKTLQPLVDTGADLAAHNQKGFTALTYGVETGNALVVEYLTARRARLNTDSTLDLVKLLVGAGAYVNLVDPQVDSQFHQAAFEPSERDLKLLTESGPLRRSSDGQAPALIVLDVQGRTTLHLAAANSVGHFELIFDQREEIEARGHVSPTVLHRIILKAYRRGHRMDGGYDARRASDSHSRGVAASFTGACDGCFMVTLFPRLLLFFPCPPVSSVHPIPLPHKPWIDRLTPWWSLNDYRHKCEICLDFSLCYKYYPTRQETGQVLASTGAHDEFLTVPVEGGNSRGVASSTLDNCSLLPRFKVFQFFHLLIALLLQLREARHRTGFDIRLLCDVANETPVFLGQECSLFSDHYLGADFLEEILGAVGLLSMVGNGC
ncbi:uncharacterized protein BO97DRAFT_425086 [Aspergillus homomorphus CBS 101889]|uniref:Uncharacterized protein n=1 Tax=Aspergillus homomorphus (strain CBS 101889) TaxID=1450537 RepID=A0A395HVE9_ASPHC|nr:hypothetical protein BO97DRAFT_425086 [Aspergillus homomorphus CBS 101889]RAL11787.1 hypothetical protein BO97DRAFT_425086 [Aspergillus homomorphus CBS 101889]